jgi:tetratricopeptide (TPR) repeat protein
MSKTSRQATKHLNKIARVTPVSHDRWINAGICASIAILSWIAFGQTLGHDFVNFDDNLYVYENPVVQQGLTARGFAWAFAHTVSENWHPLTLLSHMLDCQIYGLHPAGHHLTNVLLHTATAILLFLVLRKLTNTVWPSAFVAAVFAVHPLRVESVAWVAERKDVLSGLFFMLTLAAYVRYARGPWSLKPYLPVPILLALGLMSKPMLVTLPLVLLLLDYWPLGRFKVSNSNPPGDLRRLFLEKIPLLLLSLAAGVTTLLTQSHARGFGSKIPLSERLPNAVVSLAKYVSQLFYPANLAVYIPYPSGGWPAWQTVVSLVFIIVVTAAAYRMRVRSPYLLVGWLWYLIMLLPVLGIIQVGAQAHADRYTYLPLIGPCMALTWAVAEFTLPWRHRSVALGLGAGIILVALTAGARIQSMYWLNSESLWLGALECTSHNATAEANLANYYVQQARWQEAFAHARAALEIDPDDAMGRNCLGYILFQGKRYDDAITQFHKALNLQPDFGAAHNNLGLALMESGHVAEAIIEFQAALKSQAHLVEVHNNLGIALLKNGQPEAAIEEYQRALDLNPGFASAANNLAWLLSTSPFSAVRNGARALPLAQRACQLAPGTPNVLRTLAAAYAEAGRFPEAVQTAGQALQIASAQSQNAWVKVLRSDISLYQSRQPLRDSGRGP